MTTIENKTENKAMKERLLRVFPLLCVCMLDLRVLVVQQGQKNDKSSK